MPETAVIWEWLTFALRWTHVVTGIAWIGSSFYFIALDLGLHRDRNLASGADGEEWQVHGGGFYHVQKYLVAPAAMPDHLVWFKWESYSTWLSGFALLAVIYYASAELFLVDPGVAELAVWQAVAISMASLALGWIVYNTLCKAFVDANQTALMLALFAVLVAMAWGYTQVFSGRAALLHLGAFTATIMSANVFFIIMPNQRVVVADLKAGRKPDPKYGKIAKQRSTHNNYLTLPVVFLMLSNHYPLAFASDANWIIASLIFLVGVLIRHYFNSRHARTGNPTWTWAVVVILMIVIAWFSTAPMFHDEVGDAALTPAAQRFADAEGFEEVSNIVMGRCSMCHAAEPGWEGMYWPPKAVRLDTPGHIARHAREIYLQAGLTDAMPPGNLSFIEPQERAAIVRWYRAATDS
ncbi:MAG: urate hydroxylase PuuD [Paracoccaceae bacterium]